MINWCIEDVLIWTLTPHNYATIKSRIRSNVASLTSQNSFYYQKLISILDFKIVSYFRAPSFFMIIKLLTFNIWDLNDYYKLSRSKIFLQNVEGGLDIVILQKYILKDDCI